MVVGEGRGERSDSRVESMLEIGALFAGYGEPCVRAMFASGGTGAPAGSETLIEGFPFGCEAESEASKVEEPVARERELVPSSRRSG